MKSRKSFNLFFKSLLMTVFFLSVSSCSNFREKIEQSIYADNKILTQITSMSEDYVDYRIARTLAMVELQYFYDVNSWPRSSVLSARPVIIWKTDEVPLYYEFEVIDGNNCLGYVTCNVNKKNGDCVQYIGTEKNRFHDSSSRTIFRIHKIYDDGYPNCRTGSLFSREVASEDVTVYDWLENVSDEELEQSGYNREELVATYKEKEADEAERISKMWELIDNATQELLALTDEAIMEEFQADRGVITGSSISSNGSDNYEYALTYPWGFYSGQKSMSYCMQSVVEFIAQGYAKDHTELNISNEKIKNAILNTVGDSGGFSVFSSKNAKVMEAATDNRLTLKSSFIGTHDWYAINNHIRNNNLPVISNRCNSTFWFTFDGHSRCITGTYKYNQKKTSRFLWWTWDSYISYCYYDMWDNGIDFRGNNDHYKQEGVAQNSSHFWEKDKKWQYIDSKFVCYK